MDWKNEIRGKVLNMAVKAAMRARDEVIKTFKEELSSGRVGESNLPSYRPTQKWRREKKGLQTGTKDLQFSKTLVNSLKQLEMTIVGSTIEIKIGFVGQAYRRFDQNDSFSNDQLADYLSRQQVGDGLPLLRLSDMQKNRIENKYKVGIYDSGNR